VFDHMRGNLTAADLFTDSLGAIALAAAERALPIIEAPPVVDRSPLARPPLLPDVPPPDPIGEPRRVAGAGIGVAALAAGLTVLVRGRRPAAGGWS
jgi:nitrous oxidase accessory protein